MKVDDLLSWKEREESGPPGLPTWRASIDPARLKTWRQRHNFSRPELAKILGIHRIEVWKIEKGMNPPMGSLLRLLQVLGVNLRTKVKVER